MTVQEILRWLERRGRRRNIEGMARYGIRSAKVFGVSMATMRPLIRRLGCDHRLAQALWRTGYFEARILASFVDEPGRVTSAQMERWASQFDNWAVCDSVCLHLFDRAGDAWSKAREWATRDEEFVRRAGFAMMAALAVHDRDAGDAAFRRLLPLIGRGARDERTQHCEEGGELGAAADRQAQSRAQSRRDSGGVSADSERGPLGQVGWQRCPARAS
jgi:3-methyladenine DNA glycosylase AlkD